MMMMIEQNNRKDFAKCHHCACPVVTLFRILFLALSLPAFPVEYFVIKSRPDVTKVKFLRLEIML